MRGQNYEYIAEVDKPFFVGLSSGTFGIDGVDLKNITVSGRYFEIKIGQFFTVEFNG
jgi:hypothetical protein